MTESSDSPDHVAEQQAYYRSRAGEYDAWFMRRGRYDQGPVANARWFREVEEVQHALAPTGDVLELASGTGWWTEHLLRRADRITAVDGSPEMTAFNRARVLNDPRVEYVQADLFEWEPSRAWDAVFFGFWLSHVPPERFAAFWERVRAALRPGGRAWFVDSLRPSVPTPFPRAADNSQVEIRRLQDGRAFRVWKIFYDPETLSGKLREIGWSPDVRATENYFVYGSARPPE